MKTKMYLIGLLAVIMAFWSCEKDFIEADLINDQSSEITERKVEKSKLQNKVLMSESLKGNFIGNSHTRKMQVYTPPGYKKNGTEQYPVVYLLHGEPFSEKAFTDLSVWEDFNFAPFFMDLSDFPEEGFRLWIDNMIEEGTIDPMIIVMPDASTEPYGFSFYTNSMLNGNFEDFIVKDLVNYMDKQYNTIPNASGRAVIGHSQGGYAAFKFGMLHPDIFGTVASHSGLLYVDALFNPINISFIEQENQGGFTGPDPTKFLTSAGYAMSAAWSPNLNNPPFLVDLPFEFDDLGEHINLVSNVVDLWHENDVFTLLDSYHNEFNSEFYGINGVNVFDVGRLDELGTQLAHQPVITKLIGYEVDYTFEIYEGGHHTHIFARLATSLEFCSDKMSK